MEYAELFPNDELPLQLLLEADPDLNQITSYINDCMIYVLKKAASRSVSSVCSRSLPIQRKSKISPLPLPTKTQDWVSNCFTMPC